MWQMARNALSMFSATITGLESIGALAHSTGDKAEAALSAISSIVTTLVEGFQGKLDPKAIEAAISTLASDIASNDGKADQALVDKFKGSL